MANKLAANRLSTVGAANLIETLYLRLLRAFYEKKDRAQARKIAKRLQATLDAHPEFGDSIRAEEIRSLLAELRGDLTEAIRSREREIRKIFELHSLISESRSRKQILGQYGYGDISERLNLLALLYADQGELDHAVKTLQESKHFAAAHRVPFEGQEILDELEEALRRANLRNGRRRARAS